jgi:hypothetical protein
VHKPASADGHKIGNHFRLALARDAGGVLTLKDSAGDDMSEVSRGGSRDLHEWSRQRVGKPS